MKATTYLCKRNFFFGRKFLSGFTKHSVDGPDITLSLLTNSRISDDLHSLCCFDWSDTLPTTSRKPPAPSLMTYTHDNHSQPWLAWNKGGTLWIQSNISNNYSCPRSCWCDANHYHHLSLNHQGHWGTTDDFATNVLHFSLFSTALWDLANSRPVHSLILSSYLFLCLPCLLPPFTVLCKMVWARPDEWETWPYHCSLRLFTIVRRSSS